MTKYKLEYIWLDGYKPVPNLRGKTQLKDYDSLLTLEELPLWGFDGSSTQQAEGHSSDCVLKPVAVYPDGARTNGLLVLCEVMMPDGSPHPTNIAPGSSDRRQPSDRLGSRPEGCRRRDRQTSSRRHDGRARRRPTSP